MNGPDMPSFVFFDFVWLRIDEDGHSPGMGQVIGILYKPSGAVLYQVQWAHDSACYHYAEELTKTKPCAFTTP